MARAQASILFRSGCTWDTHQSGWKIYGFRRTTWATANRSTQSRFELDVAAFDLLEAAIEARRDIPGAMLAGYLAYDLSAELEDLGALPADDTVSDAVLA